MKYKGLEVFDIYLAEGQAGIARTSLVTLPAIESNFLYFNKDKPQFMFADEEKGELVGAIMIPDKLIYRKMNGFEFFVNFTPEVIKQLTGKMIADGTAGLFSVMHKGELESGNIEVRELWIKETENDKSIDFGIEEPIGTAFMKVKVNNERLKTLIKENGLNGFSVELDASIIEKNDLFTKVEEPKNPKSMSITDVFSNSIEVAGIKLYFNLELAEKNYVVTEGAEGKPAPYTGEFSHSGVKYTVENGVVTKAENIELSIQEALKALSDKFEAVEKLATQAVATEAQIAEKEAELELLKAQFLKDKEDFEKAKLEKREINVNLSKQMSDNQTAAREWFGKFSNKSKK